MSMTMTWTLGEHIAKARKDAGLDQTQLAKAVGIARNSLSNYETGRSVPPFDVAVRIATACGVGLDWFASAVNAETAPTEVGAVSDSVRPKGLEPLTF
ncbi:helix-turn-helix domain-containing protein [Microbacterium sp. GCS4]|uniref:helix-turn-helix domain-containing protein n=1 Tax=Microbacterium sp. GCS4 TaxID=1692239 RepID=UPI0009E359EB|nr:helix-turn-helix transcriptional regulator [Microbacterium sp. GCS4]